MRHCSLLACSHISFPARSLVGLFLAHLSIFQFIVDFSWLRDSLAKHAFQPAESYALKDPEAEAKYGFKLNDRADTHTHARTALCCSSARAHTRASGLALTVPTFFRIFPSVCAFMQATATPASCTASRCSSPRACSPHPPPCAASSSAPAARCSTRRPAHLGRTCSW